MLKSKSKK